MLGEFDEAWQTLALVDLGRFENGEDGAKETGSRLKANQDRLLRLLRSNGYISKQWLVQLDGSAPSRPAPQMSGAADVIFAVLEDKAGKRSGHYMTADAYGCDVSAALLTR